MTHDTEAWIAEVMRQYAQRFAGHPFERVMLWLHVPYREQELRDWLAED